ncbi:amidohydrolase family protein, partial [Candidatus Daviesbacteria bacterium]|nr:amidohydrolase family protein [Candidatus Daviesbacteria bacterium]
MIKLPGLIDTHVHLREPGNTHKEDFETGTKAAIAGGYTIVLDMPNNQSPVVSRQSSDEKIKLAEGRIYSDLGFHFGATRQSISYFQQVKDRVFGLKVYMNHTTGPLLVEDQNDLEAIFEAWPKEKVLMTHSEAETLEKAIDLAKRHGNQQAGSSGTRLHICHVNLKSQVETIKKAKAEGMRITCETALHYLYMTEEDVERLGNFARMRPPLGTKEDQNALWEALKDGTIDTIASDHAPHTKEEKMAETVVNGVPGLETSLPLLLNAVNDKRLTMNDIQRLTHDNPKKIFNIPDQEDTYIEVDLEEEWTI